MNSQFRISMAVPAALVVTISAIALMAMLISFQPDADDVITVVSLPQIAKPEKQSRTTNKINKPERLSTDEVLPPEISFNQQKLQVTEELTPLAMPTPEISVAPLDFTLGEQIQVEAGEYLPIVKVAPEYPRRALRRGVEGYVLLEYVVTPDGSVKDIVVIEAEPVDVFETAAIASARLYKYQPRMIDGKAVSVEGVRTKIIFNIEQSKQ